MTILVDFSGYVFSSALVLSKTEQLSMNLLRHIAISRLILFKKKLQKYNNEIVICADGRNYWRRELFPNYKKNRKKARDTSSFDWDAFFEYFNVLKEEFREYLPWKFIEVEKAEADDVISLLARRLSAHYNVAIVSKDKDFLQLKSDKVHLYSPTAIDDKGKLTQIEKSDYDLFEHIVRGDSDDGIPNILSDDDVFLVKEKRQKTIRSDKLQQWKKEGGLDNPDHFCTTLDMLKAFHRNRQLIDLTMIPDWLEKDIIDAYESASPVSHKYFGYLVKHQLMKIIQNGEF